MANKDDEPLSLDLDAGSPADEGDGSIKSRDAWLDGVEHIAGELQDEAWCCPTCFVTSTPHEPGCPDCEALTHLSAAIRAHVRSRRAEPQPDAVAGAKS